MKTELAKLVEEIGIPIQISHFPPGTSKWNKVEHRLFSEISKSWAGKPLISVETVVQLIGSTTTTTGLKVTCQPDYNDRLCGYRVYTSQYAPELVAGNSIVAFGDFSYYNVGDRGTRSMQELRELFAGNGMIGYVAKERVDGLLVLPEAVQIMNVKASA